MDKMGQSARHYCRCGVRTHSQTISRQLYPCKPFPHSIEIKLAVSWSAVNCQDGAAWIRTKDLLGHVNLAASRCRAKVPSRFPVALPLSYARQKQKMTDKKLDRVLVLNRHVPHPSIPSKLTRESFRSTFRSAPDF